MVLFYKVPLQRVKQKSLIQFLLSSLVQLNFDRIQVPAVHDALSFIFRFAGFPEGRVYRAGHDFAVGSGK